MTCEAIFVRRLRERGYRLTAQRQAVLAALHGSPALLTAEEIRTRVLAEAPSADLSTVYRTLDLLEELGLVSRVQMESGEYRFALEGAHGPHLHLICRSCGAVLTAEMAAAQPLFDRLAEEQGFRASGESLTVTGLCAACQRAAASR